MRATRALLFSLLLGSLITCSIILQVDFKDLN
jgi:hypothetical protein